MSSSSAWNQHERMRGRDVGKVARWEQAPRPPHDLGSVADSPPPSGDADGRPAIELRPAPTDFRFPTQNQTRHCYVRCLEYHRCVKAKDDDHRSECDKFQRWYRSLCPTVWVGLPYGIQVLQRVHCLDRSIDLRLSLICSLSSGTGKGGKGSFQDHLIQSNQLGVTVLYYLAAEVPETNRGQSLESELQQFSPIEHRTAIYERLSIVLFL